MSGVAFRALGTPSELFDPFNFTVQIPPSVQVGDLLICFLDQWGAGTNSISLPSGWTWTQQGVSNEGGGASNYYVFSKIAVAGDAGSSITFQVNGANSDSVAAIIVAYSGVSSSAPFVSCTRLPANVATESVGSPGGDLQLLYAANPGGGSVTPTVSGGTSRGTWSVWYSSQYYWGAIGEGPGVSISAGGNAFNSVWSIGLRAANTSPTVGSDASSFTDSGVYNQPPRSAFDATDPDAGQTDTLTVQMSQDSTFATGVQSFTASAATPTNGTVMAVTPPNNLAPGKWYVRGHVVDSMSADSGYTASRSFNLQPIC